MWPCHIRKPNSLAQEFFWLELKIKDPGNLKQKTKQYFPLILPHELFHYMRALRLIQKFCLFIYIYILIFNSKYNINIIYLSNQASGKLDFRKDLRGIRKYWSWALDHGQPWALNHPGAASDAVPVGFYGAWPNRIVKLL